MYIWGRVGPRVGSGRVRLFVGIRGSGRVGSTFRRVGSGPRKVTRGQLCKEGVKPPIPLQFDHWHLCVGTVYSFIVFVQYIGASSWD